MKKGKIFVLSGPSGVGKGTIIKKLLKEINNITYSISATTRRPRPNEVDGKDYVFVTESEFSKGIDEGKWLEWAKVHDCYYGTPYSAVLQDQQAGRNVILEIDTQGGHIVKEKCPDAIFIFIAPPSLAELARRLEGRGTDSSQQIKLRLINAQKEMEEASGYNYIIVNDKINQSVEELKNIIMKELGGLDCE